MGDLLALAALFSFAVNIFVVRAAADRLDQGLGFLISLCANIVFAALLLVGQLVLTETSIQVSWYAAVLYVVGGIFSAYLGRRGFFMSVQTLGPSRASAIQATNPVFTLVFAWVLLSQELGWIDLGAIAIVVAGVYISNSAPGANDSRTDVSERHWKAALTALVPALVAAAAYGFGNVVRGAAVLDSEEPIFGGLIGAVAGTLVYFVFHVSPRGFVARVRAADRRGGWLWFVTGLFTITGQILVIGAAAHLDVAVVIAISSAMPMVVIPMSLIFFRRRETITVWTVVGTVMIVSGVATLVLR